MRGTQKGKAGKHDGNGTAEDKRMRNNYAGFACGLRALSTLIGGQVGRREIHLSKNGDCVKKRL